MIELGSICTIAGVCIKRSAAELISSEFLKELELLPPRQRKIFSFLTSASFIKRVSECLGHACTVTGNPELIPLVNALDDAANMAKYGYIRRREIRQVSIELWDGTPQEIKDSFAVTSTRFLRSQLYQQCGLPKFSLIEINPNDGPIAMGCKIVHNAHIVSLMSLLRN